WAVCVALQPLPMQAEVSQQAAVKPSIAALGVVHVADVEYRPLSVYPGGRVPRSAPNLHGVRLRFYPSVKLPGEEVGFFACCRLDGAGVNMRHNNRLEIRPAYSVPVFVSRGFVHRSCPLCL